MNSMDIANGLYMGLDFSTQQVYALNKLQHK